jgi:hypothetical protein
VNILTSYSFYYCTKVDRLLKLALMHGGGHEDTMTISTGQWLLCAAPKWPSATRRDARPRYR